MNASTKKLNLGSDFFQFAIDAGVLRFGQFLTKAGRTSPYFFNAGLFNDGEKLAKLAKFYVARIIEQRIVFDGIFGPAYKGISLASVVATELFNTYGQNYPITFNRKEIKDHGEGGSLIGAPLKGKILIVDDVISAGTAAKESIQIIQAAGAAPAAVLIALDRQEKAKENGVDLSYSAVQFVRDQLNFPVFSIANLTDLLTYLAKQDTLELNKHFENVAAYRKQYGIDVKA